MNDPSDWARRAFLHLSAAAGASLMMEAGLPRSASALPETSGGSWAVRGKLLQAPAPDHLEAWPDALIVVGPDGVISRVEKADGESTESFRQGGAATRVESLAIPLARAD
jgi:hypothetical protein